MRIIRIVVAVALVEALAWAMLALAIPGCGGGGGGGRFSGSSVGPDAGAGEYPPSPSPSPDPSPIAENGPPVCALRTNPDPPTGAVPFTLRVNACASSDPDRDALRIAIDCGNGDPVQHHCSAECRYAFAGRFFVEACCDDQHGHGGICVETTAFILYVPEPAPPPPAPVVEIVSLIANPPATVPGGTTIIAGKVTPPSAAWTLAITSGSGTLAVMSGSGNIVSLLTANPNSLAPITVRATATLGPSTAIKTVTIPVI